MIDKGSQTYLTTMNTFTLKRLFNGTNVAPSTVTALGNSANVNIVNSSPFRLYVSNAINSNPYIITTIVLLLFWGSPSHISFLVMPININAIKRVFGSWAFPNFRQKIFKRIEAKFYSTTAIQLVFFICNIVTSATGAYITAMFRRIRQIVSSETVNYGFAIPASTRISGTTFQIAR